MILFSNPTVVANEIKTIQSLFENGLSLFHIRKPAFSSSEMQAYISAIGLEFKDKLVLHSHHELADALGINRLHFTTFNRKQTDALSLKKLTKTGFQLSTSTHSIEEFNGLENYFAYAFLSPVYESISKENYLSKKNLLEEIKKRTNFQTKLIALGGISTTNALTTLKNGFDDFALLGTIWKTDKPIENFKLCQQIALL